MEQTDARATGADPGPGFRRTGAGGSVGSGAGGVAAAGGSDGGDVDYGDARDSFKNISQEGEVGGDNGPVESKEGIVAVAEGEGPETGEKGRLESRCEVVVNKGQSGMVA